MHQVTWKEQQDGFVGFLILCITILGAGGVMAKVHFGVCFGHGVVGYFGGGKEPADVVSVSLESEYC